MKLRLLANPKFSAEQIKRIHWAFTSFESELTYKEVKLIANHRFSVAQMSTLIWAFGMGLTFEQVEKVAKVEYSPERMKQIINAYLDEFTDEQMAFILNPKLTVQQVDAIVEAVIEGLSTEKIATFANGEYDHDFMYEITEAYKYGDSAYIEVLLNPEFSPEQASTILALSFWPLDLDELRFIANKKYSAAKMRELSKWFISSISKKGVT
jgi:hypothetical protein